MESFVQSPATLRIGSRLQPVYPSVTSHWGLALPTAQKLRIYAGQPDLNDESHFTIPYEIDGKTDVIDGWLMPDDSVKLEPRHSFK